MALGRRQFIGALAAFAPMDLEAPIPAGYSRRFPSTAVLTEICSAYNLIRVKQTGPLRELVFVDGEREFIESRIDIVHPERLLDDYFQDMLAAFLFAPAAKNILMLGLGGGVVTNYIHSVRSDINITAVDIDPVVISTAQSFFRVPRDAAGYNVHEADAAEFVTRTVQPAPYDVVFVDIFNGATLPRHTRSVDFYAGCGRLLASGGVLAVNLHPSSRDYTEHRQNLSEVFSFERTIHCVNGAQLIYVGALSESNQASPEAPGNIAQFSASFRMDGSKFLERMDL